ncbi:MAG: cytochrome c oxidase assembly protein [Thermomicrobiales bacterium]
MVRALAGMTTALVAFAVMPLPIQAHTTEAVAPDRLLEVWKADPYVLVTALLAGWVYARGLGRLNEIAARTGRKAIVGADRVVAFYAGLLTLVIALASPLDAATATVFSAHMIQHVLLVAVAPPLVLLGLPATVMMIALPRRWRRPLAMLPHRLPGLAPAIAIVTMPIVAWFIHAGTLWFWHIPSLYDAAVENERIHALEHASFVLTAFLYWWTIVPAGAHARNAVSPAMGILSVFAMGMQGAALGIILTFWSTPIYAVYVGRSELWNISTLSDQRLAGLIMWIPAGSVYVVAALLLLKSWFRDDQPDHAPGAAIAGRTSSGSVEHQEHPRLGPA